MLTELQPKAKCATLLQILLQIGRLGLIPNLIVTAQSMLPNQFIPISGNFYNSNYFHLGNLTIPIR